MDACCDVDWQEFAETNAVDRQFLAHLRAGHKENGISALHFLRGMQLALLKATPGRTTGIQAIWEDKTP
jgi:hypothetical protein